MLRYALLVDVVVCGGYLWRGRASPRQRPSQSALRNKDVRPGAVAKTGFGIRQQD